MKIRNSSRITAIVLALVMLLPLISVPTFAADYTAEDILWSEDFSSYEGIDDVYAAKNNTHFFNSGGPKNMEAVTADDNTYLRFPMEIMLNASGGEFDGLDLAVKVSGKYEYWHKKYPTLVADPSTYDAATNKITFVSTDPAVENLTVTLHADAQGSGDFIYYGDFTHTDGVKYQVATPNFAYVAWIGDGNVVDKYAQLYFGVRETYTAEDDEVLAGTKKVGDLKAEPAGYSYQDYDKIVLTYKAMIESNSHGILNMQMNHFANASNPTSFGQNFVETGNLDLDTGKWTNGCFNGVIFPKDEWFDLYFIIDLDNATVEGVYDGKSRGTVSCGNKGAGGIVVNSWTISKIFKAAYYDGIDGGWCVDDVKVLKGDVAKKLYKFEDYVNDFESATVGGAVTGLNSVNAAYKIGGDAENKYWILGNSAEGTGARDKNATLKHDAFNSDMSEYFTLTADYYIPTGSTGQFQTQFNQYKTIVAGAITTNNWGDIFTVKSKDGTAYVGREGNTDAYVVPYDTWFTVAAEFHLPTNTFDLYVDGNVAMAGQRIGTNDVPLYGADANKIIMGKQNKTADSFLNGDFYLDNITLKDGEYAGANGTGSSWSEDELYAPCIAWDFDNAEVAAQGIFSQAGNFSFPNSLIFVDSDDDMTPDAVQLEISNADGNMDLMVRPNHPGFSAKKTSQVILSADYVISEDAEGTLEIQLHETSPYAWYPLAWIDLDESTINGMSFVKGEQFNVTIVLTLATGTVQVYCNNVLTKVDTNVAMVKNGLSVAEWSVMKVNKDDDAYAGTVVIDNMSLETVLEDKSENGLYLYDQAEMVTLDAADVNTVDAASMRLYAPTGLRFATQVSDDFLAVASNNMKIGTLIAPADYITEAGGVFTKEALEALPYVNSYIDVVAQVGDYYTGDGIVDDLGAGTYFTASIVNIKEANISREFAAIGYIEYFDGVNTVTIYSDNYHTASVQEIAAAALESGNYDAFEHILSAYAAGEVAPY